MIENEFQAENTRRKIEILQRRYDAESREPPSSARDLTLRALMGTINEFKEEILRYEANRKKESAASPGE